MITSQNTYANDILRVAPGPLDEIDAALLLDEILALRCELARVGKLAVEAGTEIVNLRAENAALKGRIAASAIERDNAPQLSPAAPAQGHHPIPGNRAESIEQIFAESCDRRGMTRTDFVNVFNRRVLLTSLQYRPQNRRDVDHVFKVFLGQVQKIYPAARYDEVKKRVLGIRPA